MTRVRRVPVVSRAPKRTTQWVGSADQGTVAVAAGAKVIQQSNATLGGTTIVRTRGVMDMRPQGFSADIEVIGALGIGLVSDQAFAAGIASIPGPFTDPDWDGWFMWEAFSYRFELTTDVGRMIIPYLMTLDSKAMRKVGQNQTLVVMVESQAAAFAASVHFRMLVKLS